MKNLYEIQMRIENLSDMLAEELRVEAIFLQENDYEEYRKMRLQNAITARKLHEAVEALDKAERLKAEYREWESDIERYSSDLIDAIRIGGRDDVRFISGMIYDITTKLSEIDKEIRALT